MREVTGDGWRVLVPDGLIARDHVAYDYESGALARGWIGEAPVTLIVQVRPLDGGFNAWVRYLHRVWLERAERRVSVPGAADAVRSDGVIEFDGLGAKDDRESCTTIVAKRNGRVYSLTLRSRPEDAIQPQLEPIIESFELR